MKLNTRNYGNVITLHDDIKTVNRILDNQGINLLIDAIAEYIGNQAVKYNFSAEESNLLRDNVLSDLESQINERI